MSEYTISIIDFDSEHEFEMLANSADYAPRDAIAASRKVINCVGRIRNQLAVTKRETAPLDTAFRHKHHLPQSYAQRILTECLRIFSYSPPLSQLLESLVTDKHARIRARTQSLLSFGCPQGYPYYEYIIDGLSDRSYLVRCAAIQAVVGVGWVSLVPHVTELAKTESDPRVLELIEFFLPLLQGKYVFLYGCEHRRAPCGVTESAVADIRFPERRPVVNLDRKYKTKDR